MKDLSNRDSPRSGGSAFEAPLESPAETRKPLYERPILVPIGNVSQLLAADSGRYMDQIDSNLSAAQQ